mgnify:CR=1 FL=1
MEDKKQDLIVTIKKKIEQNKKIMELLTSLTTKVDEQSK